ncbi:MAG: glycosyltransferase [Thiotrichales bacterium]
MGQLEKRFQIESNHDGSRVPYKEFKRQLRSARIAFSPWGWGEITDRDFRIVNAGALLMKPDMSHLQTDPDIFIAGETYAPVAWDLADLEEQCDYYLSRPREIRRIAANAYEAYRGFFKNQIIVRKLEALIEALCLPPSLRAQYQPTVDPNTSKRVDASSRQLSTKMVGPVGLEPTTKRL